ncbi:hypothetical protein [Stenomitos frigidus]|uniref:hypothetical protein n=1 Tax=Stenomitos frigidus TaxID=1886765 RepID=UPI0015E76030|nr:hypothetical protein [Stenomitos frigidus]
MTKAREVPNWEQLYQEKPVESMPWFNPDLDGLAKEVSITGDRSMQRSVQDD